MANAPPVSETPPQIVSALFGLPGDNGCVDVTQIVQDNLFNRGEWNFAITYGPLPNPVPNQTKFLQIIYYWESFRLVQFGTEGETITLT